MEPASRTLKLSNSGSDVILKPNNNPTRLAHSTNKPALIQKCKFGNQTPEALHRKRLCLIDGTNLITRRTTTCMLEKQTFFLLLQTSPQDVSSTNMTLQIAKQRVKTRNRKTARSERTISPPFQFILPSHHLLALNFLYSFLLKKYHLKLCYMCALVSCYTHNVIVIIRGGAV